MVRCVPASWFSALRTCIESHDGAWRRPTPALRFLRFQRLYLAPSLLACTLVSIPIVSVVLVLRYAFIEYNPFNELPGEVLGASKAEHAPSSLLTYN